MVKMHEHKFTYLLLFILAFSLLPVKAAKPDKEMLEARKKYRQKIAKTREKARPWLNSANKNRSRLPWSWGQWSNR